MPDEGMEQTADPTPEQTTDAVTEQTQEAVPVTSEGAAASGEGAAPEPVVQFQSDAELRAFLESDDRGKSYLEKLRADEFNAARQKAEADLRTELRRQAASDEVLQAAAANLARELGVEPDDDAVRRYAATFAQPLVERNQRELNRLYLDSAKAGFSADAQAAIDMAWEQAGDSAEAQNSIIGQLWNYRDQVSGESARTAFKAELKAMKPEDLRSDPDLVSLFERWREAEQEAEEKAERTRAAREGRNPGPSGARGTAPASAFSRETIDKMSLEEINANWSAIAETLTKGATSTTA